MSKYSFNGWLIDDYHLDSPTILLKNGQREWVAGDAQAEIGRIIREQLGEDAYGAYQTMCIDLTDGMLKPREEDNAEAESWRNYAIDVWHELQEIVYAKRLDRKNLLALTERMEKDL